MAPRILAQSNHYKISSEYEVVWLERIGHESTVIGDFYGDPVGAIIDAKERWCVVFGTGLIIYYLREPFQRYQYNMSIDQWKECFREPQDTWFIEAVHQTGDEKIRLVVDLNSERAGIYELTMGSMSIERVYD